MRSILACCMTFVCVLLVPHIVNAGIYIDLVDSATGTTLDYIPTNTTVTARIMMDNDVGDTVISFSAGIRVYSLGGAVWQMPTWAVGDSVATYLDFHSEVYTDNVDGVSDDIFGMQGLAVSAPGVPDGYEGLELFRVNTQVGDSEVGDTICIDSSFYPPSGIWQWQTPSQTLAPSWGGPYCYEIGEPTCYATGDANNDGLSLSVSDMVYLSAFLNGCGPMPAVHYSCDFNGDGYVNTADLTVYEDYFVYGLSVFVPYGGYPVACPCDPILDPVLDTLVIFGMQHYSLGIACYDTADGALTVSRIFPEPCDTLVDVNNDTIIVVAPPNKGAGSGGGPYGTSISNLEDAGIIVTTEFEPDSTLEAGATLQSEIYGTINGEPDQVVASFVQTKQGDSSWALGVKADVDFYSVKAYLGGEVVWSSDSIPATGDWFQMGTFSKADKAAGSGGGPYGTSISNLEDAGIINIEINPGDTVLWTWESQGIYAMAVERGNVDGDSNDETNVSDLTYLVEYAINIPTYTIISESYGVDYKGIACSNIGNATIVRAGTTLQVTNIGSSGEDGVDAEADGTDGDWSIVETVIENPDLGGTLDSGATISVAYSFATGTDDHHFPAESFFDLITTNTWAMSVQSSNPLYTVTAYNNDVEVFSVADVSGDDLGYIVESAKGVYPVGYKGTSTNKPAGIVASTDYDFTASPSGVQWSWAAQSVSGMTIDYLNVATDVDDTTIVGISHVAVRAADMPSFTILDISEGGSCCVGIRGDMNDSESVDVSDLTYLVDYLFGGGAAPICPEEGDVDGSGSIDVSDLTAMVDYLFGGGPPPADCP